MGRSWLLSEGVRWLFYGEVCESGLRRGNGKGKDGGSVGEEVRLVRQSLDENEDREI